MPMQCLVALQELQIEPSGLDLRVGRSSGACPERCRIRPRVRRTAFKSIYKISRKIDIQIIVVRLFLEVHHHLI